MVMWSLIVLRHNISGNFSELCGVSQQFHKKTNIFFFYASYHANSEFMNLRQLQRKRHFKTKICKGSLFCYNSMLAALYELISELFFYLTGSKGFRAEMERSAVRGLTLPSEAQIWTLHVVLSWQTTSQKCTSVRVARAARLFFLFHSTNQVVDLWCSRCRSRPRVLNAR